MACLFCDQTPETADIVEWAKHVADFLFGDPNTDRKTLFARIRDLKTQLRNANDRIDTLNAERHQLMHQYRLLQDKVVEAQMTNVAPAIARYEPQGCLPGGNPWWTWNDPRTYSKRRTGNTISKKGGKPN
jgi:hypothetical protein